MTSPEIYLSAQEKYAYREYFKLADVEQKAFLGKNEAISFFSKTGIPSAFLEEIWQTVDEGEKNYITETEFYVALKLIACAQNGVEAQDNILATQVSLPQFKDIMIRPPIVDIAPITKEEREKYISIFQSCQLSDGLLYGEEARNIFMRSNLPMDKLGSIWMLADTRNSNALNKTEFIIAMHYISRCMSNPSLVLPQTLPSQTYAEATGRFADSIRRHNTTVTSPSIQNRSPNPSLLSPVMSQSGAFLSPRTSHTASSGLLDHIPQQKVILAPQEIDQYKNYFSQLDTDNSGFIDAEEAVYFFSHSHLPDSELGVIWEIADSRHLGKLDLHDFSVAMHLIKMRKSGESIDKYIQPTQLYPKSPIISNQTTEDMNQIYELENHLVEIKQQINFQRKRADEILYQYQDEKRAVQELEMKVNEAKHELDITRAKAEEAEQLLEIEQQKREGLSGHSSNASTPNHKLFMSSLPELTRSPSSFSGSSIMSPRSDNGAQAKLPLSKSALKYGFDLSAFDTLSVQDDGGAFKQSSVNDDLASLFGAPNTSRNTNTTKPSDFDNIFM
ncbi:hypothetical protein BD770DRAFT_443465 [Pilaira anomala]|nr:hypothetical protein BD770DRAFT_443465 [Pilaira anomala]